MNTKKQCLWAIFNALDMIEMCKANGSDWDGPLAEWNKSLAQWQWRLYTYYRIDTYSADVQTMRAYLGLGA